MFCKSRYGTCLGSLAPEAARIFVLQQRPCTVHERSRSDGRGPLSRPHGDCCNLDDTTTRGVSREPWARQQAAESAFAIVAVPCHERHTDWRVAFVWHRARCCLARLLLLARWVPVNAVGSSAGGAEGAHRHLALLGLAQRNSVTSAASEPSKLKRHVRLSSHAVASREQYAQPPCSYFHPSSSLQPLLFLPL